MGVPYGLTAGSIGYKEAEREREREKKEKIWIITDFCFEKSKSH